MEFTTKHRGQLANFNGVGETAADAIANAVDTVEEILNYSADELVANYGLTKDSANKVLTWARNKVGKPATPPPSDTSGMTAIADALRESLGPDKNSPKNMKLKDLLLALQKEPTDVDLKNEMTSRLQRTGLAANTAVFVVNNDRKLDVDGTVNVIEDFKLIGRIPTDYEGKVMVTINDLANVQFPRNPFTGDPVTRGPIYEMAMHRESRFRILVAAILMQVISPQSDALTIRSVVNELNSESELDPMVWSKVVNRLAVDKSFARSVDDLLFWTPQSATPTQPANPVNNPRTYNPPTPAPPVAQRTYTTAEFFIGNDGVIFNNTGNQLLYKALLSRFASVPALATAVQFHLGENLAGIAGNGTLQSITFDLITWTNAHSKTHLLVNALNDYAL